MEELSQTLEQIIKRAQNCESKWENEVEDIQLKLQAILLGTQAPIPAIVAAAVAASPQQIKKRAKRLTSVDEDETDPRESSLSSKNASSQPETVINETIPSEEIVQEEHTEPEPEHVFARPKRAAKMKTDSLKEPSINAKMRRPDNHNETARKIKKEHEQRQSQSVSKKSNKSIKSELDAEKTACNGNDTVASQKRVDESVVIAEKTTPVVELFSEEESTSSTSAVAKKKSKNLHSSGKNPVVKVKKEKLSQGSVDDSASSPVNVAVALKKEPVTHEATCSVEESLQVTTTTSTDTTVATRNKRGRKKKEFNHRPIKEERLSVENIVQLPVSTRTRSGSISKPRPTSVYEDAVDNIHQEVIEEEKVEGKDTQSSPPPTAVATVPEVANIANETVNNATMVTACDATFVTNQQNSTFAMPPLQTTFITENNPNATVTIINGVAPKPNIIASNASFDVRDPPANDSIMTEDESFEKPQAILKKLPAPQLPPPPPPPAKLLKPKPKPHELFNPCVQSPVKKKVEAFEHHAASQDMRLKTRSKRTKENSEPELPSIRELKASAVTTPVIGKPHAPVLGRFLTPTQQSNVTPTAGKAKKLPNSASKIMSFPTSKLSSASNLKCSSSTSSQSLSRENSEEDLKKGYNKLQQLADERKKKRELKHQQAAALREAKEKERAERLHKLMKEREEKNRKKALEIELKKRELEEINRNLKLHEERELKQTASKTKVDAAEAARQERDLLEQMKMPRMKIPLPPKQHKYNFNMLHSDDSTDEEGKTSYKRPNPPQWSKTSVRAECITNQAYLSSDIIDSFFSVQAMTPDLKAIFPNIDPRYLKRNSSAIWSTPPRYSEMPKY